MELGFINLKKNLVSYYIDDNEKLDELLDLIAKSEVIAIDTEFTREKTYYSILSLIQIAVKDGKKKHSFIVDCLADINLKKLFQVINDPKVTKILHSSLQDLQIFYKHSKTLPKGISDTQIMANFCGFDFNIGYSALVEKFFDKIIDKSQQRSDWQKRPLTQKQIDYALSDVKYLEEIHDKMNDILESKGRKTWYLEEVKNFVKASVAKPEENLFKNFVFQKKTSKEISQIKRLILWRESWAQKLDIPRQHFLRDHVIERIVMKNDLSLKLEKKAIEEIKKIMDMEELLTENNFVEKHFLMTEQQKRSFKKAKKLISKIALEQDLKEQFLISTLTLKNLVCGYKNIDEIIYGWRFEVFGSELKKII